MNNPLSPQKIRTIIIGIVMLCIIVVGLTSQSNGQLSKAQAEALQTTVTPSVLISETPTPTVQHEPDVTFGILLAGILLMVVILFGTLHATRGLQKPPRVL
jgi:hypothetical protein